MRREEDVDPSARTEIEHHLARLQLRQHRRVAAAERCEDRLGRQPGGLRLLVEVGGDRVASGAAAPAAAGGGSALLEAARRFAVLRLHDLAQSRGIEGNGRDLGVHVVLPFSSCY